MKREYKTNNNTIKEVEEIFIKAGNAIRNSLPTTKEAKQNLQSNLSKKKENE